MTTDYVNAVYALDESARRDVRLFMMPGVLHCYEGPGPSVVDWLDVIENWHDSGQAPTELAATYPPGHPRGDGARKLCAWPNNAVYASGDPETPAAYVCR